MPVKKKESESSLEEFDDGKNEDNFARKDAFITFTNEREFKNIELIRSRICQYTGVILKCKEVTNHMMENLLSAIETDALNFQQAQANAAQNPSKLKIKYLSQQQEMGGLPDFAPMSFQTPISGIINLRFEECKMASKAVHSLRQFLTQKQLIETFFIHKVDYQDPVADFKLMVEGLQFSMKIRKIGINGMLFDEEAYGKIISHLLTDCRQLREIDLSLCDFFHPKCFFEMFQTLLNDKCRLNVLRLKNIHITILEGKVLQLVLMKNKSLHTLDISNAVVDSGECLEFFFQKFDKYSNVKYLILDNIQPDLSPSLEILGEALNSNNQITHLIMRENKLKWMPYSNLWENMKGNCSLLKINISKTDLTDRVLEKMCVYLQNPSLKVQDLDISRNQISDLGLQFLSEALQTNTSIKYLNLSQNLIRDEGIKSLVTFLSQQSCCLQELSLMGNKINNEGIQNLALFIKPNISLKMLDISKNLFSDNSFISFAAEMGQNATLTFLDISKSKDLNDEGSLITLANQLAFNNHLQTLDLSGIRIRKPFLKLYLEPSLKKNISLKYVIGKLTPDIIEEQLKINLQIQSEIETNYQLQAKIAKFQFDVHLVDPDCNSYLNMKDKTNDLFDAALKFVQQRDVRQVDFSNMDLKDNQLFQLADYLSTVPPLRSLILNGNRSITDLGISRIASSLRGNNKLAHLSFQFCRQLGNESLEQLLSILQEENLILCSIEFDENQYDFDLVKKVKKETQLNRDIQENLKPQFFKRYINQSKLRPISAAMNSQETVGMNNNRLTENKSISEEVLFQEGASVSQYLSAAIKCWKIAKPIVIQIENQQITDRHISELCEFLKDTNMIVNLNLRRNKITNIGAEIIIDWILNYDNTITHIDVSRNRISKAGADSFLKALKSLTRIIDFQIAYGNPIPLETSLAINQEIVANNQIKANQRDNRVGGLQNSKVISKNCKYELIDRGPNYMRCAIKSVELLKITHLSLPDNMLGFEESKMLSAMIKMNPPLKILNLEQNNLDAQCSKLLADALEQNSNLQILNISKNKLSDLGINYLLQSLIKSRLTALSEQKIKKKTDLEQQIESQKESLNEKTAISVVTTNLNQQKSKELQTKKSGVQFEKSPTIKTRGTKIIQQNTQNNINSPVSEKNRKNKINDQSQISQNQQIKEEIQVLVEQEQPVKKIFNALDTEEIEKCEKGQLKILNITENMSTNESYKSIWTLISINPNVVLYFDSPEQIKQQQKQSILLQQQLIKYQKLQLQKNNFNHSEDSYNFLDEQQIASDTLDVENSIPVSNEENSLIEAPRADLNVIVKPSNTILRRNQQNQNSIKNCFSALCCFKKFDQQEIPSLYDIVFWRIKSWKQQVLEFQANPEAMVKFNKPSIQNTISTILTANQLFLYIFTILPFFISDYLTICIIQGIFLIYVLIFEIILLLIARNIVNLTFFNAYLWLQFISGILKKAGILSLGLIGGICTQTLTIGGVVIGIITLLSILSDQYKILITAKQFRQIEEGSVLPYIERSQKVAQLFDYQGLLIIFKKITLLPSNNSILLSQKIAMDLNPDLIKPSAVEILPILVEKIQINYHNNAMARHLVLVDIVLLFVIVINLACGWSSLNLVIVVIILIFICDSISCLTQIYESDTNISLNQEEVFSVGNKRITELSERYNKVLYREKLDLKNDDTSSEEISLFETNEQAIDFNVETFKGVDEKILIEPRGNPQTSDNFDEENFQNQKKVQSIVQISPIDDDYDTIELF